MQLQGLRRHHRGDGASTVAATACAFPAPQASRTRYGRVGSCRRPGSGRAQDGIHVVVEEPSVVGAGHGGQRLDPGEGGRDEVGSLNPMWPSVPTPVESAVDATGSCRWRACSPRRPPAGRPPSHRRAHRAGAKSTSPRSALQHRPVTPGAPGQPHVLVHEAAARRTTPFRVRSGARGRRRPPAGTPVASPRWRQACG